MSSFGYVIDKWNIKSTSSHLDIRHQIISDDCSSKLSPVKAMAAIVDSAYSSFSGISYATDCQSPFRNGNEEQVSYMDSVYVKAVYNPSATDHCPLQQNIYCENGCSIDDPPGTFISCTHLHGPSHEQPLSRMGNNTSFQSDFDSDSTGCLSHKTKRSPTSKNNFPSPNHKVSRQYGQGHNPRDSFQEEWKQLCTVCSVEQKGSSSVLPFTVDTATVQDDNCMFSENSVYSQMNKLNKDQFKQINFQTRKHDSVKIKEQNSKQQFKSFTDKYPKEVACCKSTQHSANEFVSLCDYEIEYENRKPAKETHCYEGTHSEEIGSLAFDQQYKGQFISLPQDMKDTEFDSSGQWNIKCLNKKNSLTFYSRPSENFYEQSKSVICDDLHEVQKSHHLRKDSSIKYIPMLSHEHEQTLPQSSNLCELSDKITKASTPMLYHLAGGRNNSLAMLNRTKQAKEPVETTNESKTYQKTISFLTPADEPTKSLHTTKSQLKLYEKCVNTYSDSETYESLTSSAEESFMHDYKEKLKVAQNKVLRETSFKRKDLQMSLPVRLKLNSSKRPSIDHIRSCSLSVSNEDAIFVQPKALVQKSCKKEESEKTNVSRIGGRKRLTKEQRKLCYSEPEKLDHLGVCNTGYVWNNKNSDQISTDDHYRMKSFDKELTLSTSNLSKTALKQIQHNALVEYIERKANKRPSSIHQTQMQSSSRTQSLADWKCMTNETLCNVPQTYNHRRSTGASSSYDATVTWNDRPLKTPLLMDSTLSIEKAVNDKYKKECKRRSKSVNHAQIPPFEQLTASTSALSSNYNISNRFLAPIENTKSETEIVCTVRGRGKSMEEIVTSDKIRLSVMSQSTDQLCYITDQPVLLPSRSNTEVHQDIIAKMENELGKESRQTSKEDFLGPLKLDAVKSAQERHSRSQTASSPFLNTNNSSFSQLSQLHTRAAEQPHSMQKNKEFSDDACMDDVNIMNLMEQESKKLLPNAEEALISHSTLPAHPAIDQQAVSVHTASLNAIAKSFPEDDIEVTFETTFLSENSLVHVRPVLHAEHQDSEALSEDLKPSECHPLTKCSHEELEHATVSQAVGTSVYVNHNLINDNSDQNMETCTLTNPVRENLTKLLPPASTEERHLELVKDIISKDKSLVDVLKPLPVRESAISLMKHLFPVDISTRENCRNKALNKDKVNSEIMSKFHSKTILLLEKRYSLNPYVESLDDKTSKKIELMYGINSLLEELCIQRETLLSEITENATHGTKLEAVVKELCKPNEYERYMMFIGDLEKVVSLLFCLSMRLARVENALSKTDENTDVDEMQSLKERHNLLSRQREDAKDLKDNLDRREQVVTGILAKYLSEAQLEDYKHFVRLKTSFLIEQKDLEEKIKFHEEQLESLYNSIPP